MRILKRHPLLKPATDFVIDSPTPSNISYWWNVGSLLGLSLVIQIITGVTLAMHYNPNVLEAFNSVEHIMRDVNNGWLIRYLHSNTASAFFFLVYLHIGRGLYYGSYKAPRTLTWTIGTFIFILMMATAFLGYLNIAQNGLNSKTTTSLAGKNNSSRISNNNSNPDPKVKSKILTEFIEEKNLNPVFSYENLGTSDTKKVILEETRDLSGIYLVLNKVTLDYYIGSASTNRFNKRFSAHLINFTGSKLLKNAVRKYGISEFAFLVLELFPEQVNQHNNKKLLDLEDFYLKTMLPNYNILTEAGSSFGYKHSEITRIKMKSNYSELRRMQIGNLNRNKTLSTETVERIREKALNREKAIYSEKAIANMKKSSRAILVQNLDNSVHGKFVSVTETALNMNCSVKTISRSLKSPSRLLKKRWIVSYVEN